MKKTNCAIMLVGIAATLALSLVITLWFGFVISMLWGWFIVPLGVTAINTWHAVGISAFFTLMRASTSSTAEKETDIGQSLFRVFVYPLSALIIGALAHTYM